MHFLFVLQNYDDTDAVLDVCQFGILARQHGHHLTLLAGETKLPSGSRHALRLLPCRRTGFAPLDHWLLQRAFDRARATGTYDVTLSMAPVGGADIYLPRRFSAPTRLLDYFRRPPNLLWRICHTQLGAYFTYVTDSQGMALQARGGVTRARLLHIDPEFHEDCVPHHDPRGKFQLRRALGLTEKQIVILQVADDWRRQGVDQSLAALGALRPSLRNSCRFILVSRDSSQLRLINLAERESFSAAHVINLGRTRPFNELLTITDLLLHPAREEESGTMLLDALTAGVPAICTDKCGYSVFLHKTCCPVIPAPYHRAALADAISFCILHLNRLKRLIPGELARLNLHNRASQLLRALENLPKTKGRQLPLADVEKIVALHGEKLAAGEALKNERKRATSRVSLGGGRFLVKEFKRHEWWHLRSRAGRTERGTALLARYTPQVCGKYHNSATGSDFLIFRDCGEGNFYETDYAVTPEAQMLYFTCGQLLAGLHDAGIYHHDTKPANFVQNRACQDECALPVCLVDCDHVTAFPHPLNQQSRTHNLAQFIAGTGNLARLDRNLWRNLVNAFCDGYTTHALLPLGDIDQLWQRTWRLIESRQHIEFTLPDIDFEESTQVN